MGGGNCRNFYDYENQIGDIYCHTYNLKPCKEVEFNRGFVNDIKIDIALLQADFYCLIPEEIKERPIILHGP